MTVYRQATINYMLWIGPNLIDVGSWLAVLVAEVIYKKIFEHESWQEEVES